MDAVQAFDPYGGFFIEVVFVVLFLVFRLLLGAHEK